MRQNTSKNVMIPKKCCYMERDCTSACVAYSDANELSEGAKQVGMSGMHCMRLLLELVEKMGIMGYNDFDEEEDF